MLGVQVKVVDPPVVIFDHEICCDGLFDKVPPTLFHVFEFESVVVLDATDEFPVRQKTNTTSPVATVIAGDVIEATEVALAPDTPVYCLN